MKKWWYSIAVIIFMSIGCSPQKGPPRIMFYEKEFNFGTIDQEKSISHIFEFKNGGGDTLIIGKLDAP